MRIITAVGAAIMALASTAPASAAMYDFSFSGSGTTGTGVFTTSDTTSLNARGGYTAFAITSITGTLNGSAITGLSGFQGSDNLYYTTGPAFLDGSGVGFTSAAGQSASLFYQDSAQSYRITTVSPFAAGFVSATSSPAAGAVPEPASWAMMLSGFGLVGAGLRRSTVKMVQAV